MNREEAIRRLKNMAWLYGSAEREPHKEAIAIAIEALQDRPNGKWIRDGQFWLCSECGTMIFSESYMDRQRHHAFCGHCGARMKSEVEE